MREILISIRPEWVSKIINREKIIEIRKTMPKCELPCKVYIYCTKGKPLTSFGVKSDGFVFEQLNGKVVAEFTLNKITKHEKNFITYEDEICYNFKTCDVKNAGFDRDVMSLLDFDNFVEDYGKGKTLYGWHIDNLKIYDKPKELSEFSTILKRMKGKESRFTSHLLQRPPQSWCYCEKVEE